MPKVDELLRKPSFDLSTKVRKSLDSHVISKFKVNYLSGIYSCKLELR